MMPIVLVLAVCPFLASAPGEPGIWELSTDDTRVVVGVTNAHPVVKRVNHPQEQTSWLSGDSTIPLMARVWVDSREVSTRWSFQKAQRDPQAGKLVLVFGNADPQLILRSIWQARPGRGPVEHWLEIENRSGRRIAVGHQDSLSLGGLSSGAAAEVWWIKRGGSNASTQGGTFSQAADSKLNLVLTSNCEDGASPVPWLALQAGQERGLYVGWEFSGLGRIHARAGKKPGLLDIDVGHHPNFKTDVAPGEVFLAPPAFIGCYRGDLDEGSYALHRFVLEKLRPSCPAPDPILAYNLYLDVGGNTAKEADVLRSARTCRDLGFEAFMPDAMWFPETGDWRWDPKRFPAGIRPIEQFVHGAGMKMALWCAWTNGGLGTDPGALSIRGPVGKPEWFNGTYGPDWKPGPFYGAQLCLGCPEAKAWAIRKTQWLVGHHRLDYLKHDIGPIVTSCNKSSHRHHYGVDASYWATLGYYEVQEKLRQAFPQLILENCSGGGHIKDFGVVRRTHYTVTTDTLSNLPNRQGMYDSTFALPPLVLQCYTYDNQYPVKGDEPDTFLWRSAMMGAWQIDPTDTPRWTEAQRYSAQRSVQVYKEWIRPMLQNVKVYHILPRPDGIHWDGMFYWSPPLRRGTLYIFRPGSANQQQSVQLKKLLPEGRYWVWSEDGSIEPCLRGGKELMDKGLTICLPQQYTSDLIFLQEANLGKPAGLEPPGEFRLKSAEVKAGPFTVSALCNWDSSPNATAYRVTASDRADFGRVLAQTVVPKPPAALEDLPPRQGLFWRVEALSWGGRRFNSGGPRPLVTPAHTPLTGISFLSDMRWVKATAGAGNPVRRDKNYNGKRISLAGTPYPKGLWTHAFPDNTPADVVVDLPEKRFATFRADVGLDDASGGGSVQFQVLANGRILGESPVLRPGQVHRIRVDLAGAKQLTLRVLNGGDGYNCDHAAWGLARLLEAGKTDPLEKSK